MSRYNHRHKWSRKDYITRVLFIMGTVIVLVGLMPRDAMRIYHYNVGEPWDYANLIAEDSFPVLKSEETLQRETDSIERYFEPYFNIRHQVSDSIRNVWVSTFDGNLADEVPLYFRDFFAERLQEIYEQGIMSADQMRSLEGRKIGLVHLIDGNVSSEYSVDELYTPITAYKALTEGIDSVRFPLNVVRRCNLNRFLTSNLAYDEAKSMQLQRELKRMITPYLGAVVSGQKIVDRGQIVDEYTYAVLQSMERHLSKRQKSVGEVILTTVGQILLVTTAMVILLVYLQQFRSDYLEEKRYISLILTFFLLFPVLTFTLKHSVMVNAYLLPFCITPIFVRIFMDSRTAFFTHIVVVLISAVAVNQPAEFMVVQIVAGFTAIASLRELTQRSELFRTILLVLLVSVLTYASVEVITGRFVSFSEMDYSNLVCITLNALLLMVSYLLLIPIEKVFGFTSAVTLIELSNANTPLLRLMSEEAPGTFQHSMQVANLCAAVAERIGAKSHLVRTGALYHDIGKIRHAAFYTENQNGINPHERLTNEQSASIIISHVREGLAVAEKYKLPEVIRGFIATHHGTSMARYFYVQAQNKCPDEVVDPAMFTYPGPNPQTLEQAILMMCDAVEAASRSLTDITEQNISELVERIVDNQVSGGFFNESPITFLDIANAKEVLKSKLRIIYHTRIQYPELQGGEK